MNGYLSTDQVEDLRRDLLALTRDIRSQLGDGGGAADDTTGRVARMDAIQRQEMASAARRRLENRLRLVAEAVQRIENGEYGYCARCENPIGFARLKARPESRVCIDCQQQIESRG